MMICEKIKEKTFEGKTTKEAYLDCCKWLSTNVIAVNNSNHITYTIEKVDVDGWSRKIKLTLYVTADEQEIEEILRLEDEAKKDVQDEDVEETEESEDEQESEEESEDDDFIEQEESENIESETDDKGESEEQES